MAQRLTELDERAFQLAVDVTTARARGYDWHGSAWRRAVRGLTADPVSAEE